jgi:hypothetical protein
LANTVEEYLDFLIDSRKNEAADCRLGQAVGVQPRIISANMTHSLGGQTDVRKSVQEPSLPVREDRANNPAQSISSEMKAISSGGTPPSLPGRSNPLDMATIALIHNTSVHLVDRTASADLPPISSLIMISPAPLLPADIPMGRSNSGSTSISSSHILNPLSIHSHIAPSSTIPSISNLIVSNSIPSFWGGGPGLNVCFTCSALGLATCLCKAVTTCSLCFSNKTTQWYAQIEF